jgi:hydrogenase expression/formation protein HypC
MCLGLPGRVISVEDGAGLARVEVAGVVRDIDLSLLAAPLAPGDHLLVHSGFALEKMSSEQAAEGHRLFGEPEDAEPGRHGQEGQPG